MGFGFELLEFVVLGCSFYVACRVRLAFVLLCGFWSGD